MKTSPIKPSSGMQVVEIKRPPPLKGAFKKVSIYMLITDGFLHVIDYALAAFVLDEAHAKQATAALANFDIMVGTTMVLLLGGKIKDIFSKKKESAP